MIASYDPDGRVSLSVASGAFAQPASPATPRKMPPPGAPRCTASTATCRSTGTPRRASCSSRSRASIRRSSIRSRCASGVGSNPIGLDRGQLGPTPRRHLRARRPEGAAGAAQLPLPRDQRAATPSSARWPTRSRRRCCGGSRSRPRTATRVLVDATAFFLRDAHGVADRLRSDEAGQLPARRRRERDLPAAHEGLSRRTRRSKRR